MNRHTGSTITETQHISQSIADILSTRLGTRVMRREYGSMLVDLIDQPGNDVTRLLCYAAITIALMRWEPRIRLSRVHLDAGTMAGQFVLTVEGARIDTNEPLSLTIPLRLGASA